MPSISRERPGDVENDRTDLNKTRACWNVSEDKRKRKEMNNELYYLKSEPNLVDTIIVKR